MSVSMLGVHSHKYLVIHLRSLPAFACRCVDACSVGRTTCESICAHTRDRWSARKSTIVSTATRSSMALHFYRYTCARTQVTLFHSGYDCSRVLFPKHWWFLIDSQGRSHIGVTFAARASHQVVQWRSIDACTLGNDHTSVKRCVLYLPICSFSEQDFVRVSLLSFIYCSDCLKCWNGGSRQQTDIHDRRNSNAWHSGLSSRRQ